MDKRDLLGHCFGSYIVPTEEDYDYYYLAQSSSAIQRGFVRLLFDLCWEYAKKLADYEKRYIDDGK